MSADDQTAEEWFNYEDFAAGIDTNRLRQSARLDGAMLEITSGHGWIGLKIGADDVRWEWVVGSGGSGGSDGSGGALSGRAAKDVVEVAPNTFFIDVYLDSWSERDAVTAIVNPVTGRTLTVHTHVRKVAVPGEPLVEQSFEAGTLAGVEVTGTAPEETRELVGKRGITVYSHNHAYEHVYLSTERYSWQCLQGVQHGAGDTDLASYWKFGDGQYIFTFREFRIPVASVMFLNVIQAHSTGKFLGVQGDGSLGNGRAGGTFRILSETRYPKGYEPI